MATRSNKVPTRVSSLGVPREDPAVEPKRLVGPGLKLDLGADLDNRFRNAVDYLSGAPPQGRRLKLAPAIREAVEAWLVLEEARHGAPFPQREAP